MVGEEVHKVLLIKGILLTIVNKMEMSDKPE
jgi:hypothetical protein